MENKIKIAELLKDCPSGMELDCTMYDNLYFDRVDTIGNIRCYTKSKDGFLTHVIFHENGCYDITSNSKCVIFPKDRTTWEGFHRPFKDGDIISDGFFDTICIFKGEGRIKGTVDFYCGISGTDELFIKDVKDQDEHFGEIYEYKFATEEEKEKLFQTINDNGYQWNAETKTLEKLIDPKFKVGDKIVNDNYFDINSLVPFESKVLVRDSSVEKWRPATWGYYDKDSEYNYPYEVVGGHGFSMCIPYEGNSHLMGKTDDCDEFYKTW
jgi:hypothetical protein